MARLPALSELGHVEAVYALSYRLGDATGTRSAWVNGLNFYLHSGSCITRLKLLFCLMAAGEWSRSL